MRRAWLDGAFCLYRADLLRAMPFRTDFFLYFEETELHTRIRKAGYGVAWVPTASVEQSSTGVPPRLLGRNLQKYQHLHARRPSSLDRYCARAASVRRRKRPQTSASHDKENPVCV